MIETGNSSNLRRFVLQRNHDATGVSGTGIVADGIENINGKCVLMWRGSYKTATVYDSVDEIRAINGHGGYSQIVYID